ncbi:uncharacterized protein LOC120249543 [Dioscorea cayenensis subsp. rotundata]|uniref:Uncharacterized protein LOC120249543 n=1 Tax=Dioscorea cayennensis subsp. rotundata TaxID=55577 RepID=A0AB40AGP9_DIOCR|nr:uncharacterized protein LOC120249543 [Dioscorea cayenensis subsp. rotundata]
MEKAETPVVEAVSALKNLQLDSRPKFVTPANSYTLPAKKARPRRLLSLCLGIIGQHLEDIIGDLTEIAAGFPPEIKLALVAIARRRRLLNDDVLIALADISWDLLDVSGSDVTDFGLAKVAEECPYLKSVDISRCECITTAGVSALTCQCRSLEILRCGGCPRSDSTARRSISILKPKLNDVEEECWEELDSIDIGNGAQSLRWLVWPRIDEDSIMCLSTECPRIIVNPQPSPIGIRRVQVPDEALASVTLDHSIIEDIDPQAWAVSVAPRRPALVPSDSNSSPELHIAERFRLAFLERDARLARKRAKSARQHKRRAWREWLMSSDDAKSVALASQANKFLQN